MTLNQFGVDDPLILEQPIKDIDSFYVTWHLYGRSIFFNISTGILEILGGLLLIFNRTKLIGAILVLSILVQILIIDIAFTTGVFGLLLPFRVAGMIVADLLVLFYEKEKIIIAWKSLTSGLSTQFQYKWWVYLILPIIGFLMDFIIAVITTPMKLLVNWVIS